MINRYNAKEEPFEPSSGLLSSLRGIMSPKKTVTWVKLSAADVIKDRQVNDY